MASYTPRASLCQSHCNQSLTFGVDSGHEPINIESQGIPVLLLNPATVDEIIADMALSILFLQTATDCQNGIGAEQEHRSHPSGCV